MQVDADVEIPGQLALAALGQHQALKVQRGLEALEINAVRAAPTSPLLGEGRQCAQNRSQHNQTDQATPLHNALLLKISIPHIEDDPGCQIGGA